MESALFFIVFLAIWIGLQRFLLPKMGVPT